MTKIRGYVVSLPVIGGLYIFFHLLFDWLSFVHPFGAFGITPWNPSTGLSFLLVLLCGRRTLPLIFVAVLLGNAIVRGMPVPLPIVLAESFARTAIFGVTLLTLLQPTVGFEPTLRSVRDVFFLLAAAAISCAAVALVYAGLLIATDLLPAQEWRSAVLRYWVGDMIGIAIITPFGLLAFTRERFFKLSWESGLQVGSSAALALWVAVIYAQTDQLQLFYLLFLPVTWIAVRSGTAGVSTALVSIQLGFFVALLFFADRTVDVLDFQARMLVLAVTGLVAGVLVSERRLAETELRAKEHALAHLSRLSSMGELAAAIAHEINQPLSAAGTYTGLVAESLQSETLRDPTTVQTAAKAAAQISRAADVVRRLKTLVRLGRCDAAPTSLEPIVHEAVDVARTDLKRRNIALNVELPNDLPPVLADRLQIEQVLLNLIRNSMESIGTAASASDGIRIVAARKQPQFVELSVSDTGPGFPCSFTNGMPTPLSTSKADGLGIGLSLCRSIAEAHGGHLTIRSGRDGATVAISLPIVGIVEHG